MAARAESLEKYFQTHELNPRVAATMVEFIANRLAAEYPGLFQREDGRLRCSLTGEVVELEGAGALDALACQVQEDFAVLSRESDHHWISAIHLCFPNHWAAEEKIGKTFAEVHAPVAGMERMNEQGDKFAQVMVGAVEGLVRFVWGIASDERLNHHPEPPRGVSGEEWRGRKFDPRAPSLFLRIERQSVWGFPRVDAALFTIRTYFVDGEDLRRDERKRAALISAIKSMSPPSLVYKGIAESKEDLLRWLAEGDASSLAVAR